MSAIKHGQLQQCQRILGVELAELLQLDDGIVVHLPIGQQQGAGANSHGQFRAKFQRAIHVGQCLRAVALFLIHACPHQQHRYVVGILGQSLVQILQGGVELHLKRMDSRPLQQRHHRIGAKLAGLIECNQGVVVFLQPSRDNGFGFVGRAVFGIQFNGLVQIGQGELQLVQIGQQKAPRTDRIGIAWHQTHRLIEIGHLFFGLFLQAGP